MRHALLRYSGKTTGGHFDPHGNLRVKRYGMLPFYWDIIFLSLLQKGKKQLQTFQKQFIFFSIETSNSVDMSAQLNARWSSVYEIWYLINKVSRVLSPFKNSRQCWQGHQNCTIYQSISQEKFCKTWFILSLPKNEQVLINPNQSEKAR